MIDKVNDKFLWNGVFDALAKCADLLWKLSPMATGTFHSEATYG